MASPPKQDLSDVIRFFKIFGVWYNFNNYSYGNIFRFLQILRLSILVTIWPFSVLAIYVVGFKNCLDGNLYFSVVSLLHLIQSSYLFKNRDLFESIVYNFRERLTKYNDFREKEVFNNYAGKAWIILNVYKVILVTTILCYVYCPLVIDIGRLLYFKGDVSLFRLPMPLIGFVGLVPVRNSKFYTINTISMIWSTTSVINHIGFAGSICLVTIYTGMEIRILRCRIQNIDGEIRQDQNFTLKSIIQEHQTVIKTGKLIKKQFGLPVAVQNVIGSFNMCFTIFSIFYELDKSAVLVLANVVTSIINLGLLCGSCLIGQFLENQSELLHEDICRMPWHEQSPAVRRDIALMMLLSGRFIKIDYKGHSPLNMRTFTQIVNSAYSYFMLLKSMVF